MGAQPGVVVAATHGLLLGGAIARLTAAPIADIFVTDSIEQRGAGVHVVSVAPLLADAIRRVTSIALHAS
jgi:ribose-phosphate pyrophosphokinase